MFRFGKRAGEYTIEESDGSPNDYPVQQAEDPSPSLWEILGRYRIDGTKYFFLIASIASVSLLS